jgi:hypothetical protein
MGFHPSKARLRGQLLTITLSASRGALHFGLFDREECMIPLALGYEAIEFQALQR